MLTKCFVDLHLGYLTISEVFFRKAKVTHAKQLMH